MFTPRFPKVPPNPEIGIIRNLQEIQKVEFQKVDWQQYRKSEIRKNRHLLRLYKEKVKLSPKQKEIGLGVMLGDASLQTQDAGKTYRLKFEGGNKNRAYIQHLHDEFDELCLSDIVPKKRPTGITNWAFQTISHVDLQYFATLFLNEQRKKRFPKV